MSAKDVEQELLRIYDIITKGQRRNSKLIHSGMLQLEELLLNKDFTQQEETEIVSSSTIKRVISGFQFFYETFETNLENDFAAKVLSNRVQFEDYLLYHRFIVLVGNEVALAKITKRDRVLFIGSGPLPITAILLNQRIGCKVDCYDRVKRFADISRKVVTKLGLQDGIKIYNRRGESLGKNSYSVIVIALLAKPKDQIIKAVWNKTQHGVRIICRTSDGVRQLFYEQPGKHILSVLGPLSKVHAKGNQTISSILLKKS